jgi:hypothetical protein
MRVNYDFEMSMMKKIAALNDFVPLLGIGAP